jgi:hypothetical protein
VTILSIISFSTIISENNRSSRGTPSYKMYEYLLIKTIFDMVIVLMNIVTIIGVYVGGFSLMFVVSYSILGFYFLEASYLASSLIDVMANFDCAISIENKLQIFKSKCLFKGITISIILFSFGYKTYELILKGIVKYESINTLNETVTAYTSESKGLVSQKVHTGIVLAEGLIRDLIVLVLLVVINIFILIKMIQINKRRKNLQKSSTQQQSGHSLADRAQNQKLKMIIALFITHFIGHFPILVRNLTFEQDTPFWAFWTIYSETIMRLPFMTNFFIYYYFNNKFRSVLKAKLSSFVSFIRRQ